MSINRRDFVMLTVAAAAAGCKAAGDGGSAVALKERIVDAGPVKSYASDGVYTAFADSGFFIICHQGKLLALSSICTHRACKLHEAADHSFYCKCHGSTFDPDGKVTKGPAARDLPMLATSLDDRGHLLVTVWRA